MGSKDSYNAIRKLAQDLDDAIESRDIERVVEAFAEDCTVELPGIMLTGMAGVRRWLNWFYDKLASVRLIPVTIMIENNTFFEEFLVEAELKNGKKIRANQSEVLEYENGRVRSLRLYFDRLEFAEAVAHDFLSRTIVRRIIALSLEGLK